MKSTSLIRILTISVSTFALLAIAADKALEHQVCQKNREFSQTEITIKPGEAIVFKNDDEITHNVFSVSKVNGFNIKVQTPGSSSTVAFSDEGVTDVRCAIHPKMKLVVTVKK